MTILEALLGVTMYPLPQSVVEASAAARGIDPARTADAATLQSAAYRLTKADVLMWLYFAPNVSQGGQSYSFTDEQRKSFKSQATAVYNELAATDDMAGVRYGYKGSRL